MGMTITEKILASHSGRDEVHPGEFVMCRVDMVFANDITAPLAIEEFERIGEKRPFNPSKVAFVLDHYTPAKDIRSAEQCRKVREFARKHGIKLFAENCGIEHALLPEEGLILPGMLVVGADSHTCTAGALGAFATGVGSTDLAAAMATGELWFRVPETVKFSIYGNPGPFVYGKDLILHIIGKIGVDGALYMAMEFSGETVRKMPMHQRFTMCNMAVEAGAKAGIIEPDPTTEEFLAEVGSGGEGVRHRSDPDAEYIEVHEVDASKVPPLVAKPPLPSNVAPVEEVSGLEIDQVFIGSCTNGWLEDLRVAAGILRGRRVHPEVRLIVIPATWRIYKRALAEGLIDIFIEAGAVVGPPTCGPCLGGHMGVLAEGERCLSTTNRNFVGRMGHPKSEVYLCNPAVAAASAVKGRIAHPREVMG
ncbi:MAG TPA: 3-isopropylmalate dehydratase large subunit [Armatimonadetes bacterium]|nr:3-isopropylmalate dehydratase large subunit [Armatimonadota bacterium]